MVSPNRPTSVKISKGKGESESAAVTVPPCKDQDLETVEVSCLHDTRKISTGSPKGHGGKKKRGLEHLLLTDKAPRWFSFYALRRWEMSVNHTTREGAGWLTGGKYSTERYGKAVV